jgi:hypothetical protein
LSRHTNIEVDDGKNSLEPAEALRSVGVKGLRDDDTDGESKNGGQRGEESRAALNEELVEQLRCALRAKPLQTYVSEVYRTSLGDLLP